VTLSRIFCKLKISVDNICFSWKINAFDANFTGKCAIAITLIVQYRSTSPPPKKKPQCILLLTEFFLLSTPKLGNMSWNCGNWQIQLWLTTFEQTQIGPNLFVNFNWYCLNQSVLNIYTYTITYVDRPEKPFTQVGDRTLYPLHACKSGALPIELSGLTVLS